MDENFVFYQDEESNKLKKDLTAMLGNINSLVTKFVKLYDSNKKLQPEIRTMIYEDKIYNNRKKIGLFNGLLKNASEVVNTEEIMEKKTKSIMHQNRKEELEKVKVFIKENNIINDNKAIQGDVAYKNKMLPDKGSIDYIDEDDDIKVTPIQSDKDTKLLGKKHNKNETGNNDERAKVIFLNCYICKKKFNSNSIHSFYTNMCKTCGDFNYSFRELQVDMTGRIAVITGGRVKIGYYVVLKLLNYGCKVISTTRFPKDAIIRFKQESNYDTFKDRLSFYPLDLRLFESIDKFISYLYDNYSHIDILINNAAQTKRKSTSYYKYILQTETKPLDQKEENMIIKNDYVSINALPSGMNFAALDGTILEGNKKNDYDDIDEGNPNEEVPKLPKSVVYSQVKVMNEKDFDNTTLMMGPDGQPVDFKETRSSWNMELDEIPFQEFAETQIINAWAPYYLCAKLKDLMLKSPFKDRYIVNVSAVEGIFNHFKRTKHPHTNMAKAALNMMTRTCGKYYKDFGIYMTCVDTGWVSPMNEFNHLLNKKNAKAFEEEYLNIPLDELDGAMRVLHPIIEGVKDQKYLYGYLLKDYKISNW